MSTNTFKEPFSLRAFFRRTTHIKFKTKAEFVVSRRFRHTNFLLFRHFGRDNDGNKVVKYSWHKEDGMRVSPDYFSLETADWSFGEWMQVNHI